MPGHAQMKLGHLVAFEHDIFAVRYFLSATRHIRLLFVSQALHTAESLCFKPLPRTPSSLVIVFHAQLLVVVSVLCGLGGRATGALGSALLEAVLEAARDGLERAHAAGTGGLSPLRLLAPVDCSSVLALRSPVRDDRFGGRGYCWWDVHFLMPALG